MKSFVLKNSSADLRKQCFISQQELADYLGISYSLMAMYEKGLRTLPTNAIIKLSELQIAHEKSKNSKKQGKSLLAMQPQFDRQLDKAVKKMQHKIDLQRSKAETLNYALKGIIEKQEHAMAWLNIIDDMQEALPQTAAAKGDRLWLKLQYNKVSESMLKANEKQAKLQLQIELLQAAANVHESHQLRLKKGNRG